MTHPAKPRQEVPSGCIAAAGCLGVILGLIALMAFIFGCCYWIIHK